MTHLEQLRAAFNKGDEQGHLDFESGVNSRWVTEMTKRAKKKKDEIQIIEADGSFGQVWEVPFGSQSWADLAREHYPTEEGKILIPRANVRFDYRDMPRFNACTWQATSDYLESRWGMKLHETDRQWLGKHPFAIDDGIPTEYTLVCIQGLIEPYGMGISSVRMRAGSLAGGAYVMKFAAALGVNPFALVDRKTSNAAAAKRMVIDSEEATKLWRFEFAEQPLPGQVILCERGVSPTSEFVVGHLGGHASYRPPRKDHFDWIFSIRLAPLDQIEYNVAPDLPEYVPRRGEEYLVLSKILQPDCETPVGILYRGGYLSPKPCALCGTKGLLEDDSSCCEACYAQAWKGLQCPKCSLLFQGNNNLPNFKERSVEHGWAIFECPKWACNQSIHIFDEDGEKERPQLLQMIRTFDDTLKESEAGTPSHH